jgi:uncharacterized membrane-anchored protein
MAGVLNPVDIMNSVKAGVAKNILPATLLCIVIGIIAAYLLYVVYREYVSIPKRDRSFRGGKHNIAAVIRVELLERMKKKKKGF